MIHLIKLEALQGLKKTLRSQIPPYILRLISTQVPQRRNISIEPLM